MKGISTILALILIVIIVVALIGLTWGFFSGLVETTMGGAGGAVEETTKKLDQRILFVGDPVCEWASTTSTWDMTFTIRHDGATYDIEAGELSVIFAGDVIPGSDISDSTTMDLIVMGPGDVETFTFSNTSVVDWGTDETLTVSAPAGSIDKTVDCS